MIPDALTQLISTQRSRPLSVAVAALALFVPTSLTIFLSRPELYTQLGLNGVILLSVAMSLPIVLLSFGIWWTPLTAILRAQRLVQGGPPQEDDLAKTLSAEDPLEWPCLLTGGWTATLVLFLIAAIAYAHPLRLGATFLLTAAMLFGIWLVLAVASSVYYERVERAWKQDAGHVPPVAGPADHGRS